MTLLSAGVICDHLRRLWSDRAKPRSFVESLLDRAYSFGGVGLALIPAIPMLVWLVGPGVWTRITDGYVAIHWSRVVLAGLIVFSIGQHLVTVLIVNLIRFHTARKTLSERATVHPHKATASSPRSAPARSVRTKSVRKAKSLHKPKSRARNAATSRT